jgi:hypothetical protein
MAGLLDLFSSSSPTGGGLSLNSLLGTNVPEFLKRNLTPEELAQLESKSNFQTAIGLGKGYASQLYQNKPAWQKVVGAYSGAAEGRQAPYTTTQEGIFKALTGKKLMGDVEKLGYENQKLGLETKAIMDLARNETDPEMQRLFAINPSKYAELKFSANPSLRGFEKYKPEEITFFNAVGYNPNSMTFNEGSPYAGLTGKDAQTKANQLSLVYQNAIPAKDVFTNEVNRNQYLIENRGRGASLEKPTSQQDIIAAIIQNKLPMGGNVQQNVSANIPQNVQKNIPQTPIDINIPSTDVLQTQPDQNIYKQSEFVPPTVGASQPNATKAEVAAKRVSSIPVQTGAVQPNFNVNKPVSQETKAVPQTKGNPLVSSTYTQVDETGKASKLTPQIYDMTQPKDVLADLQKTKMPETNITTKFVKDIDSTKRLIDDLLASDGFDTYFGAGGTTAGAISTGGNVANTKALYDRFKAKTFTFAVNDVRDATTGSTGLGPLAVREGERLEDSKSSVKPTLNAQDARAALIRFRAEIEASEKGVTEDFSRRFGDLNKAQVLNTRIYETDKGTFNNARQGKDLPAKILKEYPDIKLNEFYVIVNGVPNKFVDKRKK